MSNYSVKRYDLNRSDRENARSMAIGVDEAEKILIDILEQGTDIDPEAGPMAATGTLFDLDCHQIWGNDIVRMYEKVCDNNLVLMIALVRGCAFNTVITVNQLKEAIRSGGCGINPHKILTAVQKSSPKFGKCRCRFNSDGICTKCKTSPKDHAKVLAYVREAVAKTISEKAFREDSVSLLDLSEMVRKGQLVEFNILVNDAIARALQDCLRRSDHDRAQEFQAGIFTDEGLAIAATAENHFND